MFRQFAAFASVATLSIAAAAPAYADWSYTKWGMTPEQVIAAAGGTAKPATGGPRDRIRTFDRRAAAFVIHEGHAYKAVFYFDLDGGSGLRIVQLALVDTSQCAALGKDLKKRYGRSRDEYNDVWIDRKTKDTVSFSPAYGPSPCFLTYSKE